jgi:membrane protease YdiL (CAAX protease family)
MRYRNLLLLLLGIGAAAGLAELGFRSFLPQYSITQRSGPGQITLYLIGFAGILLFTQHVARINPVAFLIGYLRDWRRLLVGFGVMFAIAFGAMILMHLVMGLMGSATFNWKNWAQITPKVWERTAVGLLVVVVLATAEEMIFRGFVLRYLRWNDSLAVTLSAIVGSALIFSLLHVIALQSAVREPNYVPLLFGLFLFGLLLGAVYVATGSLACSIGMHAGLLGFKVFQRKTELIVYRQDWFFGVRNNGYDLREGPAIWLSLLVFACLFLLLRHWLFPRFWIETAFAADPKRGQGLGFRLSGKPASPTVAAAPDTGRRAFGRVESTARPRD